MDVLKGFMLSVEQFLLMLMPVLTQGTTALNPLIRAYPWPFLFGAFVFGILAITAFRIFTGILIKIILLPLILVAGYFFYNSGSQIINLVMPLLQSKLVGIF